MSACVVVGASSGLGRALAEHLARQGRPLLLVSSDERDVAALAADFRLVHGIRARGLAADATRPGELAAAIGEALAGEIPEALLFPVGLVSDEDDGTLDPARSAQLWDANFGAVVAVVSTQLPALLERGRGAIVGFGSVAALRGRGRNVVYAAAKRALDSYFESLRHLGEPRGLVVNCYVLGYLDTNLAWGRALPFRPASPARTAERVCRELGRPRGRRYHPRPWAALALVLRALPWFVYRRLRF